MNYIKERQEEENKQLKESLEYLSNKIETELGQEITRCDETVENTRAELSGLLEEKIDALKKLTALIG